MIDERGGSLACGPRMPRSTRPQRPRGTSSLGCAVTPWRCVLLQQIMARHAPGGILSTRVVRTLPLVLERSLMGG